MAKSKPKSQMKAKSRVVDDEEVQEEEALDDEEAAEVEEPEEALDDEEAAEVEDSEEALDDEETDADEPLEASDEEIETDADEPAADLDEVPLEVDADEEPDGKTKAKKKGPAAEKSAAPARPQAKITKTAILFILLNWIAVPAFLTVAYLDNLARLQYSYRAMLNYVAVWGLPLKEEEDFPSASTETRPLLRLSPEQLKDAFKSRKGVTQVRNEEFMPVEEPVPLRLRPSDMSDPILKDVFDGVGDPVPTLEDEIERLKGRVPADIKKAADDVLDKEKTDKSDDEKKRQLIRKVFLPIAWDVWQIKKLDDRISSAKGDDLDKLLLDCMQRRLYYDILAPINLFRPGDLNKFYVEKIADMNAYDLDTIKGYLEARLSAIASDKHNLDHHLGKELWDKETTGPDAQKRSSVEKRQTIGFLMFALSQVQVPNLDRKLYPKGIERAQTVCGLREFTSASIKYVRTLRILEQRIEASLVADRQGYLVEMKEGLTRTNGQIDLHGTEVDRLVLLAGHIDAAEKRLADLKSQRDHFQKIYAQREKQHKEVMDKLLLARKNTEKYAKTLRDLQEQLHTALVELSDAADRNFALEARIREIELGLLQKQSKKGGKKQP